MTLIEKTVKWCGAAVIIAFSAAMVGVCVRFLFLIIAGY